MAFQPCPGVASVEVVYGIYGEVAENVWHVLNSGAWSTATMDAVAAAFRTIWESDLRPISGANTYQFKTIVTDLSTATGLRKVYSYTTNNVGTDTGVQVPNNVTIAMKHGTGLRGRSTRGRSYLMGLQTYQISSNNVTATAEGVFLTSYNALLAAINAIAGCKLVVLSRHSGGAARPTGVAYPITDFSFVDGYIDSQRRRLPAHNRHH